MLNIWDPTSLKHLAKWSKTNWIEWLTDRATYCAYMCAEHFQSDPTFAAYMALRFEIYEERAWLLMVEAAPVIKVVQP